ncbi:MAG TPA: hypothetical protein VH109_10495, partial [Steroidobacteraceae bacterium]|nr:hypothetical protein [Steroidobacteraceae bacterium]
ATVEAASGAPSAPPPPPPHPHSAASSSSAASNGRGLLDFRSLQDVNICQEVSTVRSMKITSPQSERQRFASRTPF